LSQQLDAIFVALGLRQVSNMFETPAISKPAIRLYFRFVGRPFPWEGETKRLDTGKEGMIASDIAATNSTKTRTWLTRTVFKLQLKRDKNRIELQRQKSLNLFFSRDSGTVFYSIN